MSQEQWTSVDRYLIDLFVRPDPALEKTMEASVAAELPAISVSPAQGKMLHFLAKMSGARTILEIGTLGGYSTIWLARALPAGGRLITLESEPNHAEVARANLAGAGLEQIVQLRLGAAVDSLAELVRENHPPFDFIFIDADKPSYPDYLGWSLKLSRPGTVIVADNIVRNGAVADPSSDDPKVQGAQKFNRLVAAEPRLDATAIQTVGSKGCDGFMLALVK